MPDRLVKAGMDEEFASLSRLQVYEAVGLGQIPIGAKVIPTKWVLVRKSADRVRARLVLRDFRDGAYGTELYAATPALSSMRLLLALASSRLNAGEAITLTTADVSAAFLNAEVPEADMVYASPPADAKEQPGRVWRLRKALYGYRRAPRLW